MEGSHPEESASCRTQVALLIPMGIVLLLPACRQQKAAEKVEGTVLDTAGKPVASVRVFNSGDGPTRIETYTDQFGRFRLDGFNSGPVYVFAEKAGCRFAGVRTTAGSTGVAIKLLQQTEPMPMRAIASASMPLDQQQELARKIVEKIWADDSRSKRCTWVMMAMSRINPELALRWSTQIGPGCVNLVRAATAEKIADEDFDEALSLIGQSGSNRPNTLVKLARRYTVPNPAKALRCAEELVVAARAVDQPWRTGYLAQAGGLAIRLGKKEAGQKLLDEAGKMADKLGTEGQNAGARGMVARAMAPSDFQRALSLLKPITSSRNDLDQLRADVAVAGCLQHLDQALAIVAKIESAYTANAARLRIAYRLAPTRPTDAIRVAESIASGRGVPCEKPSKAEALSWVAVAVAPCDKTLACSLIDRAFTILMAPDASGSALNVYGMFSGWRVRAAFSGSPGAADRLSRHGKRRRSCSRLSAKHERRDFQRQRHGSVGIASRYGGLSRTGRFPGSQTHARFHRTATQNDCRRSQRYRSPSLGESLAPGRCETRAIFIR